MLAPHPDAVAARARAQCHTAILRDALASDPLDPGNVFARARGTADPEDWPPPSEHYQNALQLADPDGTLRTVPLAEWEQRPPHDEV